MKKSMIAMGLVSLLMSSQALAYWVINGVGTTLKEAMEDAKASARQKIADNGGEGCLGLKDGTVFKEHKEEGGIHQVWIYVSEHAGSCNQKRNSINLFGQKFDF